MSNTILRSEGTAAGVRTTELKADKVKIVCVDSRLLSPQT